MIPLEFDDSEAMLNVTALEEYLWVDEKTRHVEIRFMTYNGVQRPVPCALRPVLCALRPARPSQRWACKSSHGFCPQETLKSSRLRMWRFSLA